MGRRLLIYLFLPLFLVMTHLSCSKELDHTNPFDPSSPPYIQKPASIRGEIALEGDPDCTGVSINLEGKYFTTSLSTTRKSSYSSACSFTITGIPPGAYTITIGTKYYEAAERKITLHIGEIKDLGRIILAPLKVNVYGKITLQSGGNENPEGTLIILERKGSLRESRATRGPSVMTNLTPEDTTLRTEFLTTADNGGNFSINNIPAGKYLVFARRVGFYSEKKIINIGENEEKEKNIGTITLKKVTGNFNIIGYLAPLGITPPVTSYRYTATPEVTLELYGFNATGVEVTDTTINGKCSFTGTKWRKYVAKMKWYLKKPDGLKKICVKFAGENGEITGELENTIILDTTPPTIYEISPLSSRDLLYSDGIFYWRGGELLTVRIQGSDITSGVKGIYIEADGNPLWDKEKIDNWPSFTEYYSIPITSEGLHVFNFCISDFANNITCTSQDEGLTIIKDTTPPTLFTIHVNNDSHITSDYVVSVTVEADEEPAYIMISEDPDFSDAEWKEYRESGNRFFLSGKNGEKTIYVRIMDHAGNTSNTRNYTILLDTFPPEDNRIEVVEGKYVNDQQVHLILHSRDNIARDDEIRVCIYGDIYNPCNPDEADEFIPLSDVNSVYLVPGDGVKWIKAIFSDTAGNLSLPVSTSVILDTLPPPAPVLYSPTAGHHHVNLAWTSVEDADHYLVFYAEDCVGNEYNLSYNGKGADNGDSPFQVYDTQVEVTGLHNYRNYCFAVKAVDRAGNTSELSNRKGPVIPGWRYRAINFTGNVGTGSDIVVNGRNIYISTYDMTRGKLLFLKSTLSGENWSSTVITDATLPTEFRYKSKMIAKDGKIYLLFVSLERPSGYSFEIPCLYFTRSEDNGLTWSYPQRITVDVGSEPDMIVGNNKIFISYHHTYYEGPNEYTRFYLAISEDEGNTWSIRSFEPIPVEDSGGWVWNISTTRIAYNEQEKTLITGFYAYSTSSASKIYTGISHDDGSTITWHAVLSNYNYSESSNGREFDLMTYHHEIILPLISYSPTGVRVFTSTNGINWSEKLLIPSFNGETISNLSTLLLGKNNLLFISYYHEGLKKPVLVRCRNFVCHKAFVEYSPSDAGKYIAIAGYGNGNIFATYYDSTFRELRVATPALPSPFQFAPVMLEDKILLKWVPVGGVEEYQIAYNYGTGSTSTITVSGTGSYDLSGFPEGVTVNIMVSSLNKYGPGDGSTVLRVSNFIQRDIDPWYWSGEYLASHSEGRYIYLAFYSDTSRNNNEIKVATSSDGGITWYLSTPVRDVPDILLAPLLLHFIAIDGDREGHTYLVYGDSNGNIKFMKSEDGGHSWSDSRTLGSSYAAIGFPPVNLTRSESSLFTTYFYDVDKEGIIKTDLEGNPEASVTVDFGGDHPASVIKYDSVNSRVVLLSGVKVESQKFSLHLLFFNPQDLSYSEERTLNVIYSGELFYPEYDMEITNGKYYVVSTENNEKLLFLFSPDGGDTWIRRTIVNYRVNYPSLAMGNNGEIYVTFVDNSEQVFLAKSFDYGNSWYLVSVSRCNNNLFPVVEFNGFYPVIAKHHPQEDECESGLVVDISGNIWSPW